MDRTTRTPAFGRQTSAPARKRAAEPGVTPVPLGDDEEGEEFDLGLLASVVPAPLRPAAKRVEDLGLWLLGSNAGLAIHATHAVVGFCVWYTLLHGFFGVSWCFGQAGHPAPPPDLSPPQHPEMPGPFAHPPKDAP